MLYYTAEGQASNAPLLQRSSNTAVLHTPLTSLSEITHSLGTEEEIHLFLSPRWSLHYCLSLSPGPLFYSVHFLCTCPLCCSPPVIELFKLCTQKPCCSFCHIACSLLPVLLSLFFSMLQCCQQSPSGKGDSQMKRGSWVQEVMRELARAADQINKRKE